MGCFFWEFGVCSYQYEEWILLWKLVMSTSGLLIIALFNVTIYIETRRRSDAYTSNVT